MIKVTHGDSPLVLGLPHTGTEVPAPIWERLNETGQALADTDWHIHQLYDDLGPGVTSVRTTVHRYVIDVNRDPAQNSLYPGQNTTSLVPLTDFDGQPIWHEGQAPDAQDVAQRLAAFHVPYHAALAAELARVKARHGFAILYDCHSIRGDIPFLFEGRLPDFNIGTNLGVTCDPALEDMVLTHCANAEGYSHVLNGRFRGGWTTRHYGRPDEGLHAIQMELAQATYCQESPPWTYSAAQADRLRAHLKTILTDLMNWSPA